MDDEIVPVTGSAAAHLSEVVEPGRGAVTRYVVPLSSQTCCAVEVKTLVTGEPRDTPDKIGVPGFPPPTSE